MYFQTSRIGIVKVFGSDSLFSQGGQVSVGLLLQEPIFTFQEDQMSPSLQQGNSQHIVYCLCHTKQDGNVEGWKVHTLQCPPLSPWLPWKDALWVGQSRRALHWEVCVSVLSADPCFFPLGGQENTISS